MKDYSDIGLNDKLKSIKGLAGQPSQFVNALKDNINQEPTPYLHRTSVLNGGGTLQITGGGLPTFETTTGGTQIFSYNPTTGAVTLRSIGNSGTSFLILNAGGTIRAQISMNVDGFALLDSDEFRFTPNTTNRFDEQFGPRAILADTAGTNAFRIVDVGSVAVTTFSSNGEWYQKKAAFFELAGTIADPGGGPSLSARIFSGTSGTVGKADLRVEFPTGASVKLAGEP